MKTTSLTSSHALFLLLLLLVLLQFPGLRLVLAYSCDSVHLYLYFYSHFSYWCPHIPSLTPQHPFLSSFSPDTSIPTTTMRHVCSSSSSLPIAPLLHPSPSQFSSFSIHSARAHTGSPLSSSLETPLPTTNSFSLSLSQLDAISTPRFPKPNITFRSSHIHTSIAVQKVKSVLAGF